MVRASARRPLPALAFLLGLSLLTALVWWRVIHRVDSENKPKAQSSCATTAAPAVVPQPASVTVSVLNSTQRAGLASATSKTLRSIGFRISGIGNDESGLINGVAEIRYGPAGRAAATLVSYYLPGSTLVPTSRTDATVEVSLGSKYVNVASASQVKAALARNHISQAPAKPSGLVKTPTPKAATSASRSC